MADPERPVISASGRWVALYDKGLKLWDTRRQEVVATLGQHSSPVEFSRDEKFLLCENQGTFGMVSLETRQWIQGTPGGRSTSFQALHPSNKFVVTKPMQGRLDIMNLESGGLERTALFRAGLRYFQFELRYPQFDDNIDGRRIVCIEDTGDVSSVAFDSNGQWIFFATQAGLRVMAWDALLTGTEVRPKPAFSVIPSSSSKPAVLDPYQYVNFIYDVAFDEVQNRLLFGGIEGVMRYLNLKDGSEGVLLDPPGKSPMSRLELSADRQFIAYLCGPAFEKAHEECWRVQVWNYAALCRASGLIWD